MSAMSALYVVANDVRNQRSRLGSYAAMYRTMLKLRRC